MSLYTYSGNDVRVFLGGVEVPLLQNLSGDDAYNHEPASGVGDIHVTEFIPSRAMHTITIDKMIFKPELLTLLGIIVENGDGALRGLMFDIEVQAKRGGVLKTWYDAKCDRARVTVRAHSIIVQDATFMALDTAGVLTG